MKRSLFLTILCLLLFFGSTLLGQVSYEVELNYSIVGGLDNDYYNNDWPGNTSIVYKNNYTLNNGISACKSLSKRFYLETGIIINPLRFTIKSDIYRCDHHSPGYYKEESNEQIFDLQLDIPINLGIKFKTTSFELGIFSYHRLFGISIKEGWSEYYDGNPMVQGSTFENLNERTIFQSFSKNNIGLAYTIKFNIWNNLKLQLCYKSHLNIYKSEHEDSFKIKPYRQFDFGIIYVLNSK